MLVRRLELAGLRADAVLAMEQFGMGERRACRLVELDRSSYRTMIRQGKVVDRRRHCNSRRPHGVPVSLLSRSVSWLIHDPIGNYH